MPSDADAGETAPGVQHENLQGWIPPLATDEEIRLALEKAFDYRGDVTVTLKDGRTIEGYVFDRRSHAAEPHVRIMPADGSPRVSVPYDQITRLEFTGRDTAAGKSWETWVRKYQEKKAAGEKASIEAEE